MFYFIFRKLTLVGQNWIFDVFIKKSIKLLLKRKPLWASNIPQLYNCWYLNNQNTTTTQGKKIIFRAQFLGGGPGPIFTQRLCLYGN